jgi:hypothetical protein
MDTEERNSVGEGTEERTLKKFKTSFKRVN